MSTPKSSLSEHIIELTLRIIAGYTTVLLCLVGTAFGVAVIYYAFNSDSLDATLPETASIYGDDSSSHKLLSIRLDGEIDGQAPSDDTQRLADTTYGYELKDQLDAAAKDSDIAGVILEINSPGGTIYGASAIADGVKHYRDTAHKPVYAHVSGLAASGAYWAAASTDRIIADLGSSIGSIGVIDGPFKYYDKVLSETTDEGTVITQNGIQSVTITAGKGKDEGDPYQKLTAEETANIQRSVNDDYTEFVNFVSAHRKIPADVIRNGLGAYIYGTQAAAANKLIDSTAGRDDAYAQLAKAAGLKSDDYKVVRPAASGTVAADGSFTGQVKSWLGGRHAKILTQKSASANSGNRICNNGGILAYYGELSKICNR